MIDRLLAHYFETSIFLQISKHRLNLCLIDIHQSSRLKGGGYYLLQSNNKSTLKHIENPQNWSIHG